MGGGQANLATYKRGGSETDETQYIQLKTHVFARIARFALISNPSWGKSTLENPNSTSRASRIEEKT